MARVIAVRAVAWLTLVVLCSLPEASCCRDASAQNVYVGQPPTAQPMWMSQPGTLQVGQNGAVNLDQRMMAPNGMQPVMIAPMSASGGDCSAPPPCEYVQPCPTPTNWVVAQPQPVPCPPVPVPVCPPPPPPPPMVWTIFGDALWLQPTGADVAHAQQQNGLGGAGTVPFGQIGVADFDYDLGYRFGGELQFDPCASVFAQYAFFDSSTTNVVEPPVIPGGGGAVGSLVHHPGAGLTASTGPVSATYDIEFQLGDVAYRQFLLLDCNREFSVFLGGRYGRLDQDFLQSGLFGGGLGGVVNTSTNIEFTGGGPIAGVDGEHRIAASGFSVYGRALAAALTGTFESQYAMFNTTTGTQLAQAIWDDDRIVPMLDYELGLAWTGPQGHLRLAVGYMASHWFNAVTTPVFINAVRRDNYVDVGDTVSFDGLVGHVELRW